jgi:hypothetical protein
VNAQNFSKELYPFDTAIRVIYAIHLVHRALIYISRICNLPARRVRGIDPIQIIYAIHPVDRTPIYISRICNLLAGRVRGINPFRISPHDFVPHHLVLSQILVADPGIVGGKNLLRLCGTIGIMYGDNCSAWLEATG